MKSFQGYSKIFVGHCVSRTCHAFSLCTAQSVTLTCSRCYGIRPDLCNGLHTRICSANVWNHVCTHNHLHELNSHIKGKAFNIRDLRQRIDTSWRQSGKKHYRSCRCVFCNPRRSLTCCNNHFVTNIVKIIKFRIIFQAIRYLSVKLKYFYLITNYL